LLLPLGVAGGECGSNVSLNVSLNVSWFGFSVHG
jgi:hypothetical protein